MNTQRALNLALVGLVIIALAFTTVLGIMFGRIEFGQPTNPLIAPISFVQGNHTIVAWGSATITSTPDEAQIALGLISNGATASATVSSNQQMQSKVDANLSKIGIGSSNITTLSYSICTVANNYYNQNCNNNGNQTPYPDQYLVVNILQVTVNNENSQNLQTKTSQIIDGAVSAGAMPEGMQYIFSNQTMTKLITGATKTALQNALATARATANYSGVMVNGVESVNQYVNGNPQGCYYSYGYGPCYYYGSQLQAQSVTVTVEVTYLIS